MRLGGPAAAHRARPASFGLRPGVRIMYNSLLNRLAVEQYNDHDQVPPEIKAELQEHFVATLFVMAQVSDYVVATLTSHVGRYLWEMMGAKKRLEQVGVEGELGSLWTSRQGPSIMDNGTHEHCWCIS